MGRVFGIKRERREHVDMADMTEYPSIEEAEKDGCNYTYETDNPKCDAQIKAETKWYLDMEKRKPIVVKEEKPFTPYQEARYPGERIYHGD